MEVLFIVLLVLGIFYAMVKITIGAAKVGFYLLIMVIVAGLFVGCLEKLRSEEIQWQSEHVNQTIGRDVQTVPNRQL